jgi:hypothetical protein
MAIQPAIILTMKNDRYFKFIALIIAAGFVCAFLSNTSFDHIHFPGSHALGTGGAVSWHAIKGVVRAVLARA